MRVTSRMKLFVRVFIAATFCLLSAVPVALAEEDLRIRRQPIESNFSGQPDARSHEVNTPEFASAVSKWKAENSAIQDPATASGGTRTTRSVISSTMSVVSNTIGNIANNSPNAAARRRSRSKPLIQMEAERCPADFDTDFPVSVQWCQTLFHEQKDAHMGPQWNFWLSSLKEVFQSRAAELNSTPGTASLHVLIMPNGAIAQVSPYRNAPIQASQANDRTMQHLRRIVLSVQKFPPFPDGSQVEAYHLIFCGSAGL